MATTLLSGCAMVNVDRVEPRDYLLQRRGDVLTTGTLSYSTRSAIQIVGLTERQCMRDQGLCRQSLAASTGLSAEQKTASLAELWLYQALDLHRENPSRSVRTEMFTAFMETARHAYAYLFFTERLPYRRVLEDRQGQVRDYYNFAVQQAISGLMIDSIFRAYNTQQPSDSLEQNDAFSLNLKDWVVRGHFKELGLGRGVPKAFIPASSLDFDGLRTQYRREGLGSEMVALFDQNPSSTESPWEPTPFPSVTMLLHFPGTSLEAVLSTRHVRIQSIDPHQQALAAIRGLQIPLAGNFTSGYGLWLAESGFAKQSLLTMIGRGDPLEKAKIFLMQPFDPNRQLIIMLHGLGSSPEAWVNLANEILGDPTLRQQFQVWQVYYPTQLPLTFNRDHIEKAIRDTLQHFDPNGKSKAAQQVTLIGHSMGGVLSRLLVSSSGNTLWNATIARFDVQDNARLKELERTLKPLLTFKPLEGVNRVIFIASPHRGTKLATTRFAQWLSSIIKLPLTVFSTATDVARLLVVSGSENQRKFSTSFTSISNLSQEDPFVQAASMLPIKPSVKYHSIMGMINNPSGPIANSTDGVVPYASAHLEGAESELIIPSWHSVQETPEAIVEIRRILHEQVSQ